MLKQLRDKVCENAGYLLFNINHINFHFRRTYSIFIVLWQFTQLWYTVIYHSTVSCHTLAPSMYPFFATIFHSVSICIQSILLQISSWLRFYVSAIWGWDIVSELSMFIFLFPYTVLYLLNSMQILVLFVFVWHGVETSKAVNLGICSLNQFEYHRKLSIILLYSFTKCGTQWHSWLRHCTTSWKVADSIPNGVTEILHWHNPSALWPWGWLSL